MLDANNGEIWAKLDAGTEAYYREVARSAVSFQRILDNLLLAARVRPIVIQSLFMRLREQPPSPAEQEAYCDRLARDHGRRGPDQAGADSHHCPPAGRTLGRRASNEEVDALAELVRLRTGLPVAAFYGS